MFKKRIKINFNHKSILSNINLSNTPSVKSQVMTELVFPVGVTLIQCVIEKLLTTKDEKENDKCDVDEITLDSDLSNVISFTDYVKNRDIKSKRISVKNTKEKEEFTVEISDDDIYIKIPESDSDTYDEKSYQYNIQNDFLKDGFSDRLGKIYNKFSL